MGREVLINNQILQDTADAIRECLGTSISYTPRQFASAISAIKDQDNSEDVLREYWVNRSTSSYSGEYILSYTNVSRIRSFAFTGWVELSSVNLPNVSFVGEYAFQSCSALASVNLPAATTIGNYAFCSCYSLTSVSLPVATTIGSSAFYNCSSLTSVNLPVATTIGNYAFYNCSSLTSVSLPAATTIGDDAFRYCYNLLSLYLLGSSILTLQGSSAFWSTPISGYTTATGGVYGSIYVPSSLYNSYLTATNWSIFSSRFVSQ